MKNFLLIAFFSIISDVVFTQDYVPMLGNSNQWYVLNTFEGAWTENYTTKSDTLINNKLYKILGHQFFSSVYGYLREDTVERKVYMIPNSIKDTFEIVYFDFSLMADDSIFLYNIDYDSLGYFKVDSVREINTLAGSRKAIYLTDPRAINYEPAPVWVEGIGTLGSIRDREAPPESYNAGELSCYFKDGQKLYQSDFSKELDTCVIKWSGIDDHEFKSDVTIYPNPAASETNIKVKNAYSFSICIFDLNGRLLREIVNQTKIDLRNFNDGTYLIKVYTKKDIYFKKLIIIK